MGTAGPRTALPPRLLAEIATIPRIDAFPDVDAMTAEAERIAAAHPDTGRSAASAPRPGANR